MQKNIPLIILILVPFVLTCAIAIYQLAYWYDAKTVDVRLQSIEESQARAFNPGDVRRADTTEISISVTDDKGEQHTIRQLSPLTKYFFEYNDKLTVKYFNQYEFEATIWNFTIKFYYVLVVGGYLLISGVFIGFAELKNRQ